MKRKGEEEEARHRVSQTQETVNMFVMRKRRLVMLHLHFCSLYAQIYKGAILFSNEAAGAEDRQVKLIPSISLTGER